MDNIRNFCIIAHIDHGKSTLADRLLEITGTVEKRRMKAQYLDQLELERERGITIKMAPVRMAYKMQNANIKNKNDNAKYKNNDPDALNSEIFNSDFYTLNLIDTPGHPDFGYEVSRALAAVEGAILLVDGTQGIQAQTLSNFYAAKKAGLKIIGAVNKIDLQIPNIEKSVKEVADLLGVQPSEIHRISGKTGFGVEELIDNVIACVPAPMAYDNYGSSTSIVVDRGLIFDSFYDDHKGIIAVVRIFNGKFTALDEVQLLAVGEKIKIKEVGYFIPEQKKVSEVSEGNIGYIVTGLKDPSKIKIGDTVISTKSISRITSDYKLIATGRNQRSSVINQRQSLSFWALPGYKEPKPVMFVSFYPDDADKYDELKKSLERLRLNDASFTFEPDFNEVLGRGFKGGFLGKLHFEIISQRLEREFGVKTITSFPSVAYKVKIHSPKFLKKTWESKHAIHGFHGVNRPDEEGYITILNPRDLPDEYDEVLEPMISIEIILPHGILGQVMGLKEIFRWGDVETQILGDKVIIKTAMSLAELVSDFDDRLKSVSGGFASFSYETAGFKKHDLVLLEILVAGETVPGLSRILPRETVKYEARKMTLLLKDTLPRQQFTQAVQAKALGRIIARETIPAMKKLLGNFGKTGGDRTRKMKLWKKQKEGKKKLLGMAKVRISAEDFKKLLSK